MARSRQSIAIPILMGVLAILFTIAILVGWSIQFTNYYLLATDRGRMFEMGAGYWIILAVGCLFLCLTVAVLVLFLVSNVRKTLIVRQQNTFIDSVTHELKSPLASIRLCLETFELHDLEPEMQKKFLHMMLDDVSRLQQLVEHILEASRLEERELAYEHIDVAHHAERCVAKIRERYRLAAEEIEAHVKACEFALDPVAFDTILLNLLDNAVKYSDRPARVQLHLWRTPSSLRMRVEDQGVGLQRSQLKQIFRRFFRAPLLSRSVRGTGLGLYVVKSLLQRMGGKIKAESEGPGLGTSFKLRFPVPKHARDLPRDASVSAAPGQETTAL